MVTDSETFDGLLQDARAFCEVVDFKSITVAARRLGQSKGAISRRITRLETNLSARLLARTSRAVTPTEEGMAFHAKAQAALVLLDEAADSARGFRDVPRGHLRITTPLDLSVYLLPSIITAFRKLYPQIRVEVVATDAVLDLAAHRIDLALRIGMGSLPDQSYRAAELTGTALCLYASPDWLMENEEPTQAEEIAAYPLIISEKGVEAHAFPLRDTLGRVVEIGEKAEIRASDFATVLAMTEAGAGIGLLPRIIARAAVARGALRPLLMGWSLPGLKLYAISLAGREVPARVRLFRDFMQAQLIKHN